MPICAAFCDNESAAIKRNNLAAKICRGTRSAYFSIGKNLNATLYQSAPICYHVAKIYKRKSFGEH